MEKLIKAAINKDNMHNYHKIGGYIEKYFPELQSDATKIAWKENWIRNEVFKVEFDKLKEQSNNHNISIIPLKGIQLIQNLYRDSGCRFLSDIDILTKPENFSALESILLKMGYGIESSGTWFADNFKTVLSKNINGIDINIEIHSKLLWNSKRFPQTINDQLTHEETFIHLCGHLGFAHNFSKLYWLVDIYEFVKKFKNDLNWENIKNKCIEDKLYTSVSQCLYILNKYCEINLEEQIIHLFELDKNKKWMSILTENFLLSDDHSSLDFIRLKNLTKDNAIEHFRYNLGWLYTFLKNKISSK